MNRKIKIVLVCLFAAFAIMTLAGCNLFSSNILDPNTIAVENINLKEAEIRLCPPNDYLPEYRPDYSAHDLEISIWPENATNKNVNIFLKDSSDSQYVGITAEGRLSAKKVKGSVNNEGNFVAEPIFVVIRSVSNPTIVKNVTVYVEEVAITAFKFSPKSRSFIIGDAPWQLVPEFVPRHAVIGMDNINFVSTNEEYATVDDDGFVTPSADNVGPSTIVVTTIADGVNIQGEFDVEVKYEVPSWTLNISNSNVANVESLYSQIVDHTEPIGFYITTTQLRADNNPVVEWYINKQWVPNAKEQSFTFTPDNIRGSSEVSVKITDENSQIQEIKSSVIEVYEMLTPSNISLSLTYADPIYAKDKVYAKAYIEEGYYPAENIDWMLYNEDTGAVEDALAYSVRGNDYGVSFILPKAGRFKIIARCSVKLNSMQGNVLVDKVTDEILEVEPSTEGNDIQNVQIEGIKHGGNNVPFVVWDGVGMQDVTIEVSKNQVIKRLDSLEYASYAYHNGFAIPATVARLDETFSVRIKGEAYGYTESVTYSANTITPAQYQYLNVIDSTLNLTRYISDLKQLAKIINYFHMFRPAEFVVPPTGSETRTGYKITLYTPLKHVDLDNNLYHMGEPSNSSSEEEYNIFKLINAANNAYGESGKYSFSYSVNSDGSFDATFYFEEQSGGIVKGTEQNGQEKPTMPHYTLHPREEEYDSFSTDNEQIPSISVVTSNQLYLAVSWGLRPLPASGSAAEAVYEAAKTVLRRIIDDSMTEAEKVHAIYDFLSCEVLYDNELLHLSERPEAQRPANFYNYAGFHMEGVFLHGSAVCDGIAKSFLLLSYMEGIQAVKVSGKSNGVGHAWNYALVNGKWYGVDATWASRSFNGNSELSTHKYLLVTDEQLAENHITFGEYPPTEEEGLVYAEYYDKKVTNTPDFDHVIDPLEAWEFEALYHYYANIVAQDTELVELYIEFIFVGEIDQDGISEFFTTVNVGVSFNYYIFADDFQVVYVIVQ